MPVIGLGVFRITPELMQESVESALESGYKMFDTAKGYDNEKDLGKALARCAVAREELFITTKIWTEDVRKGNTRRAFLDSLQRLAMEYIDLYLIHWPVDGFERAWEEMTKIYEEKLVRAVGVSNFDVPHMEALKRYSSVVPAVHQMEFHPWKTQSVWRNYAKANGIHIEAYGPFMQGGEILRHLQIKNLAEKHGKTAAQIILRWNIQSGISVIPKSCNRNRIFENMDIFDFCLDNSDMELINSCNKDLGNFPAPYNITW
jgi:diketogulonate reductase-like aldo/keto reductase